MYKVLFYHFVFSGNELSEIIYNIQYIYTQGSSNHPKQTRELLNNKIESIFLCIFHLDV